MKKIKMKVNGMHCMGCVNKIKNGIMELTADQKTDVNLEKGEVFLELTSKTVSAGEIKNKIQAVGFEVESIEIE